MADPLRWFPNFRHRVCVCVFVRTALFVGAFVACPFFVTGFATMKEVLGNLCEILKLLPAT